MPSRSPSAESILNDISVINSIPSVAHILEVVCNSTGMGFAAVARVTEDKWIACAVNDKISFGLIPGGELKLETTICNEIRQHKNPVVIDHVALDEQYSKHHTPLMYGFQSYISLPIMLKSGAFFGTLCAIDPNPNVLNTPQTIGMFKLFAELIAFHLDSVIELEESEFNLLEERENAELREQFIAILGHDLRNPVGASLNAAQLLLKIATDEKVKRLAQIVQKSSYRINGLIENVLDFARGRLGGGIKLDLSASEPLIEVINQVINELKLIWPNSAIEVSIDLKEKVVFDGKRIAQLFSNLLSNALSHGEDNVPIIVNATSGDGLFTLCIINQGKIIPEEILVKLFQPFFRGAAKNEKQGLGLGLYISSEIAKAHRGQIKVDSLVDKTCFTFSMPTR
ncbi:GAF domain-containing sensor histidine kinase [Pedobacter frigiditerrae]|uniref:histidine kinase n=1 Tax=Pedobacter frigiditerrae TaxID=2530452 RepID=A0A4R0MPC3_9SPHI|nr:GAF domain-containing sensor histidine kinase [Pedobacter frigiditerrae]TCC88082.1 GAF domain-containing sensor histidine kinase [Pedobacter frigiditerrae]